MDVLLFANSIYNSQVKLFPKLENQLNIIYTAAVLHDMCDKKYMNPDDGLNEIQYYFEKELDKNDLYYSKIIMKTIFSSGKTKDLNFRIEQLKKLKTAILEFENKLSKALYKDLGKSKIEAYTTEIGYCLHELSLHIRKLKSWSKAEKVATNRIIFPFAKSYIQKEPLGNILVIAPWNYPFGLSISPLIGAISAGNCITLKPSEISFHTGLIIQEMLEKYFDEEYIRVIQGGAKETQELLKEKFDYIFFTGGEYVGKIVMEAASKKLTPVTLELGGKSPCIVDKNCNLEKTASRIVYGKFLNAGQTCVAPDYLLVDKRIKDKLIEKLTKEI
jgi:aldehyde dehydrogenase (NAD+)